MLSYTYIKLVCIIKIYHLCHAYVVNSIKNTGGEKV